MLPNLSTIYHVPLQLTTSPIWSCQSGTCTINPIHHLITCMALTSTSGQAEQISKIMYTHTTTKVQLIYNSLIVIYLHIPDYTCSINSCCTKPEWILVSYHQDDVITISASISPDSDLDDDFSQPPAKEILQLIDNIKHIHMRHSRSLNNIF